MQIEPRCSLCDDTGWKMIEAGGVQRAVRCNHDRGALTAVKEILSRPALRRDYPQLPDLSIVPHPERVEPQDMRVARLVAAHRGKQNAIKLAEVIRLLGAGEWDERSVKASVSRLLKDGGMRIGSSRGKDCGYYLITSAEELAEMRRQTGKHALAWIRRWKSFEPTPAEREEYFGQLRAEFGDLASRSGGS